MRINHFPQGIRARFIRWTAILAISISILAAVLFFLSLHRVVQDIESDFAKQYTLREKERILAPLEREVALCETLTKMPSISDWVQDEKNPALKVAAFRELESFRKEFRDKSCFFAIRSSGNYYFRDESTPINSDKPAYTMHPENAKDAWFYSTLKNIDRFHVNVDQSAVRGKTMVWINTVIHRGNERVAIAGTGLNLNTFIEQLLNTQNKAVTPILVDSSGAIQAHSNTNLIDQNTLSKRVEDRSTIFRLMPNEAERAALQKAFISLKASPDSIAAFSFMIEGQHRHVSVAYLPEMDWYLLSLIDLSRIIPMSEFAPLAMVVLLALGVLVAAITLLINHTILRPLSQLTATAHSVAAGDYSVRATAMRKDEFGDLIQTFNSMLDTIESNTRALKQNSEELEHRVQERTRELQKEVKERQKAERAAQQASQAKSEFLANMSHEIRTPMNAVLGFSEILENKVQDPRQREYVRAIHSSGKSLLSLINDVLDLSKVEAGKMRLEYSTVNPGTILKELEMVFSAKIEDKGLTYFTEIKEGFPKAVVLDETRLRQVLLNLIGNAIKFTDHGFVRVVARALPQSSNGGLTLVFEVHDSGIGIPNDQMETIFKAFEQKAGQSHAKYGGTGLGLTISKRLTELMGGKITVESTPGKGSIFSVILQNVEESALTTAAEQEVPTDHSNITFEPATILVAEDVSLNRELIKGYLEGFQFEVLEALNGREAIAIAHQRKPALILMDIKMPEMDGTEASRLLKEDSETRSIPIVAVTASTMKADEAKIKTICEGFLRKPIARMELLNVFARFLKHSIKVPTPPGTTVEPEPFFESDSKDLYDPKGLKNRLETELAPLWKEAQDTLIVNQVLEFAEKTIAIANAHKAFKLAAWADKLRNQTMLFDMSGMEHTLSQFPNFLSFCTKPKSSEHIILP